MNVKKQAQARPRLSLCVLAMILSIAAVAAVMISFGAWTRSAIKQAANVGHSAKIKD